MEWASRPCRYLPTSVRRRSTTSRGFLVTFRAAPQVDLVRYYDDEDASPSRPFITRAATSGITVNSSGVDSRGIAIDTTDRQDCEDGCSEGDDACLKTCAAIPANVYIANRAPPSLLIGETRSNVSETGSNDLVTIYDSVPLYYGASRVVFGYVIKPRWRARTACLHFLLPMLATSSSTTR